MTENPSNQHCKLCQVEIHCIDGNEDLVYFSTGTTGNRARLWARVCQYIKTEEQCNQCINQDVSSRGEVLETDYYSDAPNLDFSDK
uniref:Uncharacterized protein n=1 Tax=Paulinella chromatophora TaxID=39717 RepID=B1X3N4_PAUCH|nr:hypothetical protein PCC_0101 [Paulinella chromatophora]ACB42553.1 hypothetical protein PCC_0101 [Paulinella chromatophora]